MHGRTIDAATEPVLRAVLGNTAVAGLRSNEPAGRQVAVVPVTAAPWLRVAIVDALDRWLHAPLHQALVDAERGVSLARAAQTLADGRARAELVGDALRLARHASRGVTALLRRLTAGPARPPAGVFSALRQLVEGYADLLNEVEDRRDEELSAVLNGWRRVAAAGFAPGPRHVSAPAVHAGAGVTMIDPRQLPARVLALSDDPVCPEISTTVVGDEVRVRVPAFGTSVDPDVRSRLAARIIDRRSGRSGGHGLLTCDGGGFAATVPLNGMDPANVRADVFDVLSGRPPARSDADTALQEARRAVVFLAGWRRLVGMAQLGSPSTVFVRHLRDLADRARPGFPGAPDPSDLDALAKLGGRELRRVLRDDVSVARTRGAAELLVAELVALHLAGA